MGEQEKEKDRLVDRGSKVITVTGILYILRKMLPNGKIEGAYKR